MNSKTQRCGWLLLVLVLAYPFVARSADAQKPGGFGRCIPRAQRGADIVGCFIMTEEPIGKLGTEPVYWYVSRFRTKREADAARRPHRTVVTAFDTVWLMTIGGKAERPSAGTLVSTIGPLPITSDISYSALYMEASMSPGMKSEVHRHSGPEAWYTLSGETCLETPTGTMVGRAGGPPVIVPGGGPMELTATGTGVRRSLVLILHDARESATTMEKSWRPTGACGKSR